jgi:hypothetical protein
MQLPHASGATPAAACMNAVLHSRTQEHTGRAVAHEQLVRHLMETCHLMRVARIH